MYLWLEGGVKGRRNQEILSSQESKTSDGEGWSLKPRWKHLILSLGRHGRTVRRRNGHLQGVRTLYSQFSPRMKCPSHLTRVGSREERG